MIFKKSIDLLLGDPFDKLLFEGNFNQLFVNYVSIGYPILGLFCIDLLA